MLVKVKFLKLLEEKMNKRKFIYVLMVVLLLMTGCNHSRSKDTLSSSNTKKGDIILQLETNHFKFYSKDDDKGCMKDLSNALEDNYSRITNDLKASLDKKVEVYIYSDLSTYHKARNQPNAPNWLVGNAIPDSNIIQMVSPLNADGRPYSDLIKVIVHEFTHVVEDNIKTEKDIPLWINEGVAVYEAKQIVGTEQAIVSAKSTGKFPTLKDLETDSYTFGNNNGYTFSYLIVDYIVKTYGYEKLIDLIKTPSEFEKILGLSKEDFQKNWISHLN